MNIRQLTDYDKVIILKMTLEGKFPEHIADKIRVDVGSVITYVSEIIEDQNSSSLTETSFQEIVLHYEILMKKLQLKKEGMSQINNYTELFEKYMKTSIKPDKKYSMLYTTLQYLSVGVKTKVLDVGCGSGYFTLALGEKGNEVIGIDNNATQIKAAQDFKEQMNIKNIDYFLEDMRTYHYPKVYFDYINAPFVINYSKTVNEMKNLFQKRYDSLKDGGILFSIMDNPSDIVHNNKRFGSIKLFPGKQMVDGAIMEMMLYNGDDHLCTLYSCFYQKITIEQILKEIGFKEIQWRDPLIDPEGIEKKGWEFWGDYMRNCDIMYFSAKK